MLILKQTKDQEQTQEIAKTTLTFSSAVRSRESRIFSNDIFVDILEKFYGIGRLVRWLCDPDIVVGQSVKLPASKPLCCVFNRIHY